LLVETRWWDNDKDGNKIPKTDFFGWNTQTHRPLYSSPLTRVVADDVFDMPLKSNLIFHGKTRNLFSLQTNYDSNKNRSENLHWRDELSGRKTILPFDFGKGFERPQWHPSVLSNNSARLVSVSNEVGNGFSSNGTDGTLYSFDWLCCMNGCGYESVVMFNL